MDNGANVRDSQTTLKNSGISRHPDGKTQVRFKHDKKELLWSWNLKIYIRWGKNALIQELQET